MNTIFGCFSFSPSFFSVPIVVSSQSVKSYYVGACMFVTVLGPSAGRWNRQRACIAARVGGGSWWRLIGVFLIIVPSTGVLNPKGRRFVRRWRTEQ